MSKEMGVNDDDLSLILMHLHYDDNYVIQNTDRVYLLIGS